MKVRRVVLGVGSSGKSDVLSDEEARRSSVFKSVPGFEATLLWSTTASSEAGSNAAFSDPHV